MKLSAVSRPPDVMGADQGRRWEASSYSPKVKTWVVGCAGRRSSWTVVQGGFPHKSGPLTEYGDCSVLLK